MSNCAVANCKNYIRATKGSNVKYFRFPKDENLAKQWVIACSRQDKINLKNARICSVHFEDKCFEVPLKERLLKYEQKNSRHLKPDAVPTLNLFKKLKRLNQECEERVAKNRRQEEVKNILEASLVMETVSLETETPTVSMETATDSTGTPFVSTETRFVNTETPSVSKETPTETPLVSREITSVSTEAISSVFTPCVHCRSQILQIGDQFSKSSENIQKIRQMFRKKQKIKNEISETDYYNSGTASSAKRSEQTSGKLGIIEVYIKEEIYEETIKKEDLEDLNLFENEISNSLKSHNTKNEKEDRPIPLNDSDQIGKFEMIELEIKKEINEEIMIKEDSEDLNLSENEALQSSKFHQIKCEEEEDEYILPNDSTQIDSQSLHSDTDSSDGRKRIDTNEGPFKCGVCQKTFKFASLMKVHNRVHSSDRPHSCEICQKSYKDIFDLRRHKRIHTGLKPHTCKICQKSFRELSTMKNHLRIHTGEKPHICKICQKSFRQLSHMKIHERTHVDNKPFTCAICQKSFKELTSLKKHEPIHTGHKPYCCETCHKSFTELSSLKRHQVIHTGEKPHSCSTCQKSFSELSSLRKHERTHTGHKPHKCQICQRSFGDLTAIKNHLRIHTGQKPFACDICQKSFRQLAHMKRHQRTHIDNNLG